MANNNFTLHIFWFGNTQLNQKNGKTVKSNTLTTIPALINDIKAKKPQDKNDTDYHAINIFDGFRADFLSKEKDQSFSVKFADIDADKLSDVIEEIKGTLN